MLQSPGFAFTVLAFLIVIGPLVFVHELGHYFVARWFGVKADTFSIGFGRELFGWTDRRGTRWKVGWLPLGGYVRFAGDMNPASQPSREWLSLPAEEREKTFQAKAVWKRFLIVAAGPVTNFLFAILVLMGIFAAVGYPTIPAVVATVEQGSPAQKVGIKPGDRIIGIGDKDVGDFDDLRDYVILRPGEIAEVRLLRGPEEMRLQIPIAAKIEKDDFGNSARIGRLGVAPDMTTVSLQPVPFPRLPGLAISKTVDTLEAIVLTTKQLIVGQRSVKELGGPLKMAQVSGQQASLGWLPLFWLMAMISINLGFINLLPIPLLDGGHLVFYAIEGLRRKPLKPEAQEWAFRAGLAALLMLMIFVTLNDLASFGLWTRLGGLIG